MATIHDVARAAGVSIATVSRSLNGRARVSETTRARVLQIAEALDFHPNRSARGLVTGRLGNVGVLVPDLQNPFFTPIIAGVESVAQRRDMGVLIADTREDVAGEVRLISRLRQQVDGVILVASRVDEEDLIQLEMHDSTVLVNRAVSGMSTVAIDATQGMADLVDHFANLGHMRIAYLDGPRRSTLGDRKRLGLVRRAQELDIEILLLEHRNATFRAGRIAAEQIKSLNVTAVAAFNDLLAWGLLTRLQELGVEVPRDISVAGFDDALDDGMVRPTLTSVATHGSLLGIRAMEALSDKLECGDIPANTQLLSCEVKARKSTGVPSS